MEALIDTALSMRRASNNFMALLASLLNGILLLESLIHSIVLLAWRLSLGLGFVLLVFVIIQLYLVPKEAIRGVLPSPAPAVTEKANTIRGDLPSTTPAVTEKPKTILGHLPSPAPSPAVTEIPNTIRGDLPSTTPAVTEKPKAILGDLPSTAPFPDVTEMPNTIRGDLPSTAPVPAKTIRGGSPSPGHGVTVKPRNADPRWHVFINHRGPDTKLTLASIILHRLRDKGYRVFLNRCENQMAEEVDDTVRHAIDSAWVHIAIFSKTYAESSSCLNELCLMLETGALLIPVFFDVKPWDLRWIDEQSVYREAFAKRKDDVGHNPQKLTEWKSALKNVSNIFGWELEGQKFNGNWGRLLKSVVNAVVREIYEAEIETSAKLQDQNSESIWKDIVLQCDASLGNNQFSLSFSVNIVRLISD